MCESLLQSPPNLPFQIQERVQSSCLVELNLAVPIQTPLVDVFHCDRPCARSRSKPCYAFQQAVVPVLVVLARFTEKVDDLVEVNEAVLGFDKSLLCKADFWVNPHARDPPSAGDPHRQHYPFGAAGPCCRG